MLAPASQATPGLAGRAERHSMQPVAQQIGVADRAGLARQDEEHGLEDVLGEMSVAQELAADGEDHRTVSHHQGRERRFPGTIAPGVEPLQELAVGQSRDGATLKEQLDLVDDGVGGRTDHVRRSSRGNLFGLIPFLITAPRPAIVSQVITPARKNRTPAHTNPKR